MRPGPDLRMATPAEYRLVAAVLSLPERRMACWLEDKPALRVTMKNYRKGCRPGNWNRRFPATPPTPAEMLRILDCCPETRAGLRNRALLATLWRSGLRISEALALLPHEIDFEHRTVTVLSGKGGKRRVVGIDQGALREIARWSCERMLLPIHHDSCPLFCTISKPTPGRPLWTAYTREMLKELGRKAHVPHRLAPHQLRHAHAAEMAREKVPMHLIQRQLGHSNLGTTATYLSSIAPQEVIDVVSVREWPGASG